ncbi:MAG: radical SAM protein [Anaerolineae bacterium]|nr:radical SAM protein [Anaerolineae bacterium]
MHCGFRASELHPAGVGSSGSSPTGGEGILDPLRHASAALTVETAWSVRTAWHEPVIRFDRPVRTLPVSLTGEWCALQCAHCGGHYLQHMRPVWQVDADGATSLLISGGCDSAGRVPLTGHLDTIARLRRGRRLNWHVGFVDEQDLARIAPYVDVVSFDIVGDAETAREVYGLEASLGDYMRTLDLIQRHVPVVPHITIGLRGGRLSGEWAAIEALRERDIGALILIILIPTPGTAYADREPPALEDVRRTFIEARTLLPETRILLGCMRPHGAYRRSVDELAVRAGLNGIVNPTLAAQRAACELGLEIVWGEECCALSQ